MMTVFFKPLSVTRVHLFRQNPLWLVVLQPSTATRNYSFLSSLGEKAVLLRGWNNLHKVELSSGYALHCQCKLEGLVSTNHPVKFSHIRSAHVNDPGSINSPLMLSMEKKIMEQLNAESVSIKDTYGDGRHVSIDVVASCFEGQSAVSRQRMVYKSIWEELQSTVHAVDQMTTRTPAEVAGDK
ncbi:hypothetical protein SAY87_025641 [Trapa incisa]|uniref:Uncharacterized protein n=1 Tax=Trapa incisa TaxID=236973 RepID=A0AAN7JJ91_9MYRT|nr:hypothetical protein SAY87_025641 [Trapa incisa]